jgi:hypothetical protein
MAYPAAIVEISFTDGPYVVSPTWVDVTSYVREITVRRGRTDEFQDFDAGTASVTLDNRDRRFDPLNSAGPYFGQLTPRRQIRIRAANTVAGVTTTHDVYRGYVAGWPCRITDAGFDATVALECFDALGLLAREELPDDLGYQYIQSLNPRNFWPLDDPIDQQTYRTQKLRDYGSNPKPLEATQTFRTGNVDGMAEGITDTAITVAEPNFLDSWVWKESARGTLSTFSMAFWFEKFPNSTAPIAIFSGASQFNIFYDLAQPGLQPRFNWTILDPAFFGGQTANITLDINEPHHLIFNVVSNRVTAAWVDGQALTVGSYSGTNVFNTITEGFEWGNGRKQHIAIFPNVLTAAQATTLYQLSVNRLNETAAARFNRLINYTPFPPALTSVSASATSVVSSFTVGGPDIASELQLVSDSEGGNLFVTKAGVLKMTSRNEFATGTSLTSQATIGTTGITIGTELDYHIDSDTMRNQLSVGFAGDGSIEVTDTASVTTFGVSGGSWSTQLADPEVAESLGDFLVGFSKDPRVVTSPVDVNVSANAADWNTVLGLELLNRITLTVQPNTGPVFTQPQLIQSIEHRVTPGEWRTTLNGSVRFTNPFIIGSSLLGGPDLIL